MLINIYVQLNFLSFFSFLRLNKPLEKKNCHDKYNDHDYYNNNNKDNNDDNNYCNDGTLTDQDGGGQGWSGAGLQRGEVVRQPTLGHQHGGSGESKKNSE